MIYKWEKNLETGNVIIDAQHKQLINAVNSLLDACTQGKGRLEVETTLAFLGDYTISHFADEEDLQIKANYPEYPAHKKYHDDFKVTFTEFAQKLKKEGPTDELVGEVYVSIGDWLTHHIKYEDAKMAAYVQRAGAA
ncbi:MAG: bacteriohemerythrin [Desulfarculales bacterium]|jgi:hemerythrin|nr:bacteriohemerythrin [Desulfarculales bacterium]